MNVSVIVDDTILRDIVYYGTQWVQEANLDSLYNRTLTVCHTEIQNTTLPPSFTFYFYGSDINVYGPLISGIALNYSIDSTSVRPGIINSNEIGKNNSIIWNLQGLEENVYHNLEIIPSAGLFSIDYLTYTPNKYTDLAGRNLILDDGDDTIQYSGNWTKTTGDFAVGLPYKGTVSGSSTKGSTIRLDFVGASISVYGLLNQKDGKLSASFSVDGGTSVTYTPFDGTQNFSASSWLLSQQFFHQDLVPGNHSLLVTLEEVTGSQTFWIDSLIFEGTSNTLLTQTSTGSSGAGPTPTSDTPSNAVVGGIIVAGIVLLIIFCYAHGKFKAWMRRMTRENSDDIYTTPATPPSPMPEAMPFLYPPGNFSGIATNSGYDNPPSSITPSMPYFHIFAPALPTHREVYHPPPVAYSNTNPVRPPQPPQQQPSPQAIYTDSPLPRLSHLPQPHAPKPPQPPLIPQPQPDPKSQPLKTDQTIPVTGSSSSQAKHTAESGANTVDDPPPYNEKL